MSHQQLSVKRTCLGVALMVASLAGPLGGCKFFDISNPLVPQARLFAVPVPTMIDVNYTYKRTDNTIAIQEKAAIVKVSSFPRDTSPGTTLFSYAAEYFDQAGKPIPTLLLSRVNFGVSAYVAPASAGTASSVDLQLPMYNQQVKIYGIDQVFSFAPGVDLNRNLIHTVNCKVTLFGEDDNFNQVQIPVNVPIRFDGQITQ